MKTSSFVDPNANISKQEMLTILKEQLTPESIVWLTSFMNEMIFSPDEAGQFEKFIIKCCDPQINVADYQGNSKKIDICKPILLFDEMFFPELQESHYSFTYLEAEEKAEISHTIFLNMERTRKIYHTDRLNTERIKCIPLLFTKVNNIDTFYPCVGKIIKAIKNFCTQSEEFARAYKTKLGEIWNTYGSLQERLVLYVNSDTEFIRELEQPSLEMLREYLTNSNYHNDSLTDSILHKDPLVVLLFISLLQVDGQIQIPCWNDENYFCRLLLDYGIVNNSIGFVDALFRNHSVSDAFNIMRTHMDWRSNNMPHYQEEDYEGITYKRLIMEKRKKIISHRRKFIKYLQDNIPLLFSCSIPRQYRNYLYAYFFTDYDYKIKYVDHVQKNASAFLRYYLASKLNFAINIRNHDLILDIYNLFKNGNEYWFNGDKSWFKNINTYPIIDLVRTLGMTDIVRKKGFSIENIPHLIPLLIRFCENGDKIDSWDILEVSQYDADLLKILLIMKNTSNMDCPPLSLEDFTLKYLSLDIFDKVLSFSPFLEQNEDRYQNMFKEYPNLRREDALLERLLPCFTTIAIRNINKIPSLFDILDRYDDHTLLEPWRQLILCVLDKLCGTYETEPDVIASIFEIVFKIRNDDYSKGIAFDIFKKNHKFQKPLFEYCYKIINSSWDMSMNLANIYAAASIIEIYKGVWHGLKSLLIVLRKTRKAWVNSGLKADNSDLQKDNRNIVQEIEYHYTRLSPESSKQLRQDMANGLSDWLKPLPKSKRADLDKRLEEYTLDEKGREGFDITYTEPNPIWRYAYVRAIADLGVDVDGKGHYIHTIMNKVAQNDPSAMVREAAEKTFIALKNLRDGWDGENHKRNISLAFWWIWQASRLAINLPVNREDALLMRNYVSIHGKAYPEGSINVFEQTQEKLMRERFGI